MPSSKYQVLDASEAQITMTNSCWKSFIVINTTLCSTCHKFQTYDIWDFSLSSLRVTATVASCIHTSYSQVQTLERKFPVLHCNADTHLPIFYQFSHMKRWWTSSPTSVVLYHFTGSPDFSVSFRDTLLTSWLLYLLNRQNFSLDTSRDCQLSFSP